MGTYEFLGHVFVMLLCIGALVFVTYLIATLFEVRHLSESIEERIERLKRRVDDVSTTVLKISLKQRK